MRTEKTIYIHLYDFENEANEKKLADYDRWAMNVMRDIEEAAKQIKQYRLDLYEHCQKLQEMKTRLQLDITRRKDYHGKVFFYITVKRLYEDNEKMHRDIISETYTGSDRSTALKRFEALKKEYPGIEATKNIEKGKWER